MFRRLLFVAAIALIFLSSCGSSPTAELQVSDISASGTIQQNAVTVLTGQQVNVSVTVSGKSPSFKWDATGGTFSDISKISAIYTAPATPGDVGVSVTVTSDGMSVTKNLTIRVIAPTPTDLPIIVSTPTLEPTLAPPTEIPSPTALQPYRIYVDGNLGKGLDMGVAASDGATKWMNVQAGEICMHYPKGKQWGSVFIMVQGPGASINLASYSSLSLELKGQGGKEYIWVGLKDKFGPNDGSEKKILIKDLTTDWQTYSISLTEFENVDLTSLNVVPEFVFEQTAETICARNIQFLP